MPGQHDISEPVAVSVDYAQVPLGGILNVKPDLARHIDGLPVAGGQC
jgi:hypothetical protein